MIVLGKRTSIDQPYTVEEGEYGCGVYRDGVTTLLRKFHDYIFGGREGSRTVANIVCDVLNAERLKLINEIKPIQDGDEIILTLSLEQRHLLIDALEYFGKHEPTLHTREGSKLFWETADKLCESLPINRKEQE